MTQATLYQKDRLLAEIHAIPGLSTPELAALVGISRRDTAYSELRKLALKGLIFSRRTKAPGGIHAVCRWFASTSPPIPTRPDIRIDESDIAWMAHYRTRHKQRQNRQELRV